VTVPTAPAPTDHRTGRRGVRPVTIVLGTVCALLAVLWVYAFFIAEPRNPNRMEDRDWVEQAEATCAATRAELDRLPDPRDLADVDPLDEALRQRALIGEDATNLLEQMVDDLEALPQPTGPDDAQLVSLWLADWRTQLSDRRAHVERWRAGEDEPFRETAFNGRPLGIRLADFTTLNEMDSCAPPGDFG
jgi:hypothetical protein